MIRFYNSTTIAVDVKIGKKLLFSNVTQGQATKYARINPGKNVIRGVSDNNLVFELRLKSKKKFTVVLSDKLQLFKDEYEDPCPGVALVRKLSSSSLVSSFVPFPLGPQLITEGTLSVSADLISGGVYTAFFYPNATSLVLYNEPCPFEQELCFEEYIGVWNVVEKIGISETTYNFSEVSDGRLQNSQPFYWIVHETDYETYSLNGTPNRQRLAILARPGETICTRKLVKKARKLGYNI